MATERHQRARGDAYWRASQAGAPVLELEATPWVSPPPLERCRVAIVTTAGLSPDGPEVWEVGDQGFRVIPDGERSLAMAQASNNFDRTGFLADLNVVFPVDRLHELAARGAIGSVAPRHLSFMGAQADHTLATLRLDTGPAAAQLLRDDHVDAVVLTPV